MKTALEVAACICIVAAGFLIHPALGLFAAGLALYNFSL